MPDSFEADPADVKDYTIDWASTQQGGPRLLSGETLTASTWAVPSGITQTTPAPSFTAEGVATIWLTGGTIGMGYRLTNHVTTSAGRQYDDSITVQVIDR